MEVVQINKEQSIVQTINLVMSDLAKLGISKDMTNEMQKYKYRGIDQVYDTVASIYAKHGLVIMPQVLEYSREMGLTAKGTPQAIVVMKVKFTFMHVHNEQTTESIFYGESNDTSDKATNKAETAAYKYMAIMTFSIPINGSDNDADNDSNEHGSTNTIAKTNIQKEQQNISKAKEQLQKNGPKSSNVDVTANKLNIMRELAIKDRMSQVQMDQVSAVVLQHKEGKLNKQEYDSEIEKIYNIVIQQKAA